MIGNENAPSCKLRAALDALYEARAVLRLLLDHQIDEPHDHYDEDGKWVHDFATTVRTEIRDPGLVARAEAAMEDEPRAPTDELSTWEKENT